MQASAQARLQSDINITPLIDIVMVLLIVFIVIVPVLGRHQPVVVPASGVKGFVSPGFPVVTIRKDGRCQLWGEPVSLEQLTARLVPEILGQPKFARKVQVKVDGAVPLRRTSEVLDAIRAAGDRARRATPGFAPAPDDADHVHKDDIHISIAMKKPG